MDVVTILNVSSNFNFTIKSRKKLHINVKLGYALFYA